MNAAMTPIVAISHAHLAHRVIRASAGSGKTHALSGRYLSLLAAGEQPSRILATTFTRAAAGEIRDRLLRRLADAINDDEKRRELAKSLGVKSISQNHALAMLRRMTANLHALQIRTLDSFFASIVRNFSIELGLPPECSVIDENDDRDLRKEATRLMLDERDPQPLIDLQRLLTRGDSDRDITSTIDNVIVSLYELWREADESAWTWLTPPGGLLGQVEIVGAIEALRASEPPADKRFVKAWLASLAAADRRDWSDFLGSGLAKAIVAGSRTYYSKTIDEVLLNVYEPLVRHAAAELVHRLHEQTLATRTLMQMFHAQYDHLKRVHRVLNFGDLTHAMIGAGVGERDRLGTLDDLGFRLDASIHHLLLDEFQDTSGAQWQALSGMANEVASQSPPERTFFCVGDVKQSIYGWRGASPEILDRLPSILPGVVSEPLDMSYRSSQLVIDAVNQVFHSIAENAALAGDPAHEAAGMAWQAGFHAHTVAKHLCKAPGHVQMRTIRIDAGDKAPQRARKRLEAAAELAASLHHRDASVRIAILTRTNASVARLLYELGPAGCNVPASGRGGGPLIDASPVTAILDLLHLADHPDDTTAAFNVAQSPLGKTFEFTDHRDRRARRRLAREVRLRLLLDGYQRTIARWTQLIASSCDTREVRRLAQLVELAGVHDASDAGGGIRTAPFIDVVESKDVPDAQPAPIEVMTVHQAKGLEFDAVILPELTGRLRGSREPMVVFDRDDASGRVTRIARYPKADVQALMPELQELVQRTRMRVVRESLSVLYVALTRAKHGLYVLIDPCGEKEKSMPRTFEGVLRSTWCPDECPASEVVHEAGDADWIETTTNDRKSLSGNIRLAREQPDRIEFASNESDAARADAAVSASSMRERMQARSQAGSLREQLALTNPEGRERGSVIHTLFEQIEWIEEFADVDDPALLAVTCRVAPRRDERWHQRQIAAFRKMIARPALREALSRNSIASGSAVVRREWRFARLIDGLVQTGSIDRLVLRMDEAGRVMAATVIDFKTDAIVEASTKEQAETHRTQLELYRDAVAEMFRINARSVTMQVMLVGAGAVVTLE